MDKHFLKLNNMKTIEYEPSLLKWIKKNLIEKKK
jgi:hypothetical protein